MLVTVYTCAYNIRVTFQWDPDKAKANRKKHRIDFADAIAALEDPYALTRDDPHPREQRFVTLGLDALGRPVVISWTRLKRSRECYLVCSPKCDHSKSPLAKTCPL